MGPNSLQEFTRYTEVLADTATSLPELLRSVVRMMNNLPKYNWVGIYVLDGDQLRLAHWRGPAPTEHITIPIDKGICGAAVREGKTIIVGDVTADPRYLQCFLNTRAEIVVPIWAYGKALAEIDIDSDIPNSFTEEDRNLLEEVAATIARYIEKRGIPPERLWKESHDTDET